MSNHFHLMIETPDDNHVAGMRWLLSSYTGALRMLDDALLDRKAALSNKRLPIEVVRKRLAAG